MNSAKLILFFLPPPFETFFNFFTAEKGPFCSHFINLVSWGDKVICTFTTDFTD